jgi:hypothetical protein
MVVCCLLVVVVVMVRCRNDPKILAALAKMQKKKQSFVELTLLHKYSTIAMQELEFKAKHLRGQSTPSLTTAAATITAAAVHLITACCCVMRPLSSPSPLPSHRVGSKEC